MADDLYALLSGAAIAPPYVLVGHSIGGIVARRFYARYPGLTAGIVLVDSSHEDQERHLGAAAWRLGSALLISVAIRRQTRILGLRRFAASLGLVKGLIALSTGLRRVEAARAAHRA